MAEDIQVPKDLKVTSFDETPKNPVPKDIQDKIAASIAASTDALKKAGVEEVAVTTKTVNTAVYVEVHQIDTNHNVNLKAADAAIEEIAKKLNGQAKLESNTPCLEFRCPNIPLKAVAAIDKPAGQGR